jgi:outer membrane biosynthesis protein TonB
MSYALSATPGNPRPGVNVPRIWITVALSILLHALLLWQVKPDLFRPSNDADKPGSARGPLSVQIAPRFRPPTPPSPPPSAAPSPPRSQRPPAKAAPRLPPPKAVPRPAPKAPPPAPPPVIALNKPAPQRPVAPPAERAPVPAAPRVPSEGDLSALLEARRRARGEAAPPPSAPAERAPAPTEDPNERANRIAAANIGTNRTPEFGADPKRGGGVFTVRRLAYDYAEFLFYGWNKDIKRNTAQVIEVRKGNNSDIRIAVVRRMIGIIRDHEQGDFVWESPRLGRNVNLSARQRDSAALEAFLMKEFFEDDRRPVN